MVPIDARPCARREYTAVSPIGVTMSSRLVSGVIRTRGSGRSHDRKPQRFSCRSTFACALLTCVLPSTLVGARKLSGRCTARQVVPTQRGNSPLRKWP